MTESYSDRVRPSARTMRRVEAANDRRAKRESKALEAAWKRGGKRALRAEAERRGIPLSLALYAAQMLEQGEPAEETPT